MTEELQLIPKQTDLSTLPVRINDKSLSESPAIRQKQLSCIAASYGTRISDASTEERIQLANYIIAKTGTKFKTREEAIEVCGAAFTELIDSFPFATLNEVALAYQSAAKGEFEENGERYKLFQTVSAPQIREVYLMWLDSKRDLLREAIKNQALFVEPEKPTKSESEILQDIESELSRAKEIVSNGGYYTGFGTRILFDYLRYKTKQLVVNKEDISVIWKAACERYLMQKRQVIPMFDPIQNQVFMEIKRNVESSEIGKHSGVLNIVKEELLNKWLNENIKSSQR